MDKFRALQIFVTAAESDGFASAAERLRTSPTAVTRSIAALERQVGARLFTRTTRSVRLTEVGEGLLHDARKILADLADAEASASGSTLSLKGPVRITAPVLFGRSHVAPAVLSFMPAYPEITVEFSLSDRNVDLVTDNVDFAVRVGALDDSSLSAVRTGSVRRALCAAPAYLTRRGAPRTLDELRRSDGVELASASPRQWIFQTNGRDRTVRPRILLSANSPEIVIDACLAGLGVARFMDYQVSVELASGRLVQLLEDVEPPTEPIHLVYSAQGQMPRRVRALFEHLKASLSGKSLA